MAISGFRRDVEEICALFWGVTQLRVVIQYRHFGTTYSYHLQVAGRPGPIGCPEASVRNYHYTLRSATDRGQNSYSALLPQTTSTNSTSGTWVGGEKGVRKFNIKKVTTALEKAGKHSFTQ